MSLSPYLIGYLGIGVVVLIAVFVQHRLSSDSDLLFSKKSILEANPGKNKVWLIFASTVLVPVLAVVGIVALWPLLIAMFVQDRRLLQERRKFENYPDFGVQHKDLLTRHELAEIEAKERVMDPMHAVPEIPFGHLNPAWNSFLKTMADGDMLWSFRSHWVNRWKDTELHVGYVRVHGQEIKGHFLIEHRAIESEEVTVQ
jgi:hypothetical protein